MQFDVRPYFLPYSRAQLRLRLSRAALELENMERPGADTRVVIVVLEQVSAGKAEYDDFHVHVYNPTTI